SCHSSDLLLLLSSFIPIIRRPATSTLFPYTTLFRSEPTSKDLINGDRVFALQALNKYQAQTKAWRDHAVIPREFSEGDLVLVRTDRKSTRLNSSHVSISYAVFCLKKKST